MVKDFKKIAEILPEVIEDIENNYYGNFSHVNRTYYKSLDTIIDGFNNGELITIAGEKNNFSNLFMLNIAKNCILKGEKPILLLDFGAPDKYSELLEIIRISKDCKYHEIPITKPVECIYERIQNFIEIYSDGMVFINGLDQILNDRRFRFEFKDKLEPLAIKLKNLARKNNIPIVIALNLSMSQRYFRDEYVEIYDLGIYDAFACYSDKVLTTKVFDYDSQDLRRDFDVRIVKNNNGKNDTLYFGLYQETLSIIECNYNTNTNKSSVAF